MSHRAGSAQWLLLLRVPDPKPIVARSDVLAHPVSHMAGTQHYVLETRARKLIQ
jgi:hypothetical protein